MNHSVGLFTSWRRFSVPRTARNTTISNSKRTQLYSSGVHISY